MSPGSALAELADLLLPAGCVTCGAWIPGGRDAPLVCGPCRSRFRRAPWPRCLRCDFPTGTGRRPEGACRECRAWPPALGHARSAYVMAPPVDRVVHALKYGGWRELAEEMGREMADLKLPSPAPEMVVPVPTTPRRLRAREYNQADVLARPIADRLGLPLAPVLRRAGEGRTQVSLRPSERRANVADAFSVRDGGRVLEGRRILLVDDVLTTGATAGAAAAALLRGGACAVTLVTYARALPQRAR